MKAWQLNTTQWQHFLDVFEKIHGKSKGKALPTIRCEGTNLAEPWKSGGFTLDGVEYQSYHPATSFGRSAMLAVRKDFLKWTATILAQKERIHELPATRQEDKVINLIYHKEKIHHAQTRIYR